ncbi:MAG: hypothetical protein ACTSWP_05090 [Candidatus Freyarchaeota archaeon]
MIIIALIIKIFPLSGFTVAYLTVIGNVKRKREEERRRDTQLNEKIIKNEVNNQMIKMRVN